MTSQGRTQWHCQLQHTPIAIIGMSALFPKARNLREYWCNIVNKVDCITEVPESYWKLSDYFDEDPKTPDKTYSNRGGFLPKIDFDPLEFGLPPSSLEAIDSAQLLSLVVAKSALEDAGYGGSRHFNREATGVVLGASGLWKTLTSLTSRLQYPIWRKVLKSSGLSDEDVEKVVEKMKLAYAPWQENSFPGMLSNVIAGRITNRFDLGGTNCTVDAACASSLSAFKMAVGELIERRCDLMITGGVDTDNSILTYMCFSKTPAFSRREHLSPFDAKSDGMMVGEGLGMLVLKRLDDAERDGDRIYAVIRGIGTSSDGRYKSIYAPRPEGQMLALRRAYEDAGFSPATVGLMEAHGTGTPRGDFCEFTSLKTVFGEDNPRKQHIALGSVKSQIGHTKAAAGAASLIKTALALHHKILPPTINVFEPNPKFDIDETPFYINTEVKPWFQSGKEPRRAAVSSFGFGGTNYHVALEEYNAVHNGPYRLHAVPQAILLWEQTPEALRERCQTLLDQLKTDDADRVHHSLVAAYKTVDVPTDAARIGMVVQSQEELRELLGIGLKLLTANPQADRWEHPRGLYYRKQGLTLTGRVVALFPGQGAQYINMGRKLTIDFPLVHQAYKRMDDLFVRDKQTLLTQIVFPQSAFESMPELSETEALQSTRHAQPAIGAFSFGLYQILHQAGLRPSFAAGHSFGELTALWAAGVFSDEDYFELIKARGAAMASHPESHPCETGTMLSVQGDIQGIEKIIQSLSHVNIANFNGPNQVVLSGSRPEIAAVQQIFSNNGYVVKPLSVSAAFHSPFIRHASEPFAAALDTVTFNPPQIAVYANTTGEMYPTEPAAIKAMLKEHLLKPVYFDREIENIYAEGGDCFIEIGPRRILTGLVEDILGDRPHVAVALNASRQKASGLQLRQAVIQLQVAGLGLKPIDKYQLDPPPDQPSRKSSMQIRLDGNNYVSDKTKQAFAEALIDGHQVSLAQRPTVDSPATVAAPAAIPVMQPTATDSDHCSDLSPTSATVSRTITPPLPAAILEPVTPEPDSPSYAETSEAVTTPSDSDIATTAAAVTLQEARVQPVATESVETVTPLPIAMLSSPSPSVLYPVKVEAMLDPSQSGNMPGTAIENLLTQFCSHQSEVLRVHEQYLKGQALCSQSFLQVVQQLQTGLPAANSAPSQTIPPTPEAAPTATAAKTLSPDASDIASTAPVAPSSQPEQPLMNGTQPTVADGTEAIRFAAPAVPSNMPAPVVTMPPVAPVAASVPSTSVQATPSPVTASPPPIEPSAPAPVAASANTPPAEPPISSVEEETFVSTLLAAVSDKTGYPAEMLELGMELESDLGIDSIKRVEIMGVVQDTLTDLPRLDTEELGELRSLQQIVDYLKQQLEKKNPARQFASASASIA